jgi:hypothetical protein
METSPSLQEAARSAQPLGAASANEPVNSHFADASDLRAAWVDAVESIDILIRETRAFLTRQGVERPELLMLCSAGLGFVLGGGLASRTGALVARAGVRMALAQVMQSIWDEAGDEAASRTQVATAGTKSHA